ncbi:MAG: hypothetical protein LC647_05170 [Beggiatoa sp.]|nr:hypothetical protein [Beggiatoa sp.]
MTAQRRPPLAGAKTAEAVSVPPQPPSRIGKKSSSATSTPNVSKQLKQMALDGDTSTQELLREALNDFSQKHGKPAIA